MAREMQCASIGGGSNHGGAKTDRHLARLGEKLLCPPPRRSGVVPTHLDLLTVREEPGLLSLGIFFAELLLRVCRLS